ncbi:hypothetical protein C461_14840 [Halorubrum aidingense JCM 13560]|uniref:Uncharacterized protein n=1 Tax=Halorubrum aidingense JCM 13560 TaxID=1230454 RepID=M0P5N7_9EURY|nr:DUF6517 family protein [Halorubrum aidingense]EMA65128.1 hypothetical protein C461_14840 [Halorubrum aidingense JCM 13560]
MTRRSSADPPSAADAADLDANADTTTRRRALAVGGAVGIAGLAGCTAIDVFTGDEPAEFTAGTATVADAVLDETGYELNEIFTETVTQQFEVAGSTREVRVTNRVAEYDRAVELFGERYQAAVFAALATPRVEVLGQAFNPIADLDDAERAELILNRYDNVEDLERGSEYTTSMLDTDVDVVVYTASAEISGAGLTVDVELHVGAPVEAGEDYVLPLAAYPEDFGDGEVVRRMINGIEYSAEE